MSVIDVLQECRDAGIRIAARDGKLLVGDAQSRLSPELRRRLAEHKSAILDYLHAASSAPASRIVHHQDATEHPLSYAQRRLWFLHQLDPGSVEYNLSLAFRVRGVLDTDALRAALDAIVKRHAVLRTAFVERDGEPVQVVHPHRPLQVRMRDVSALAPDVAQREALRLAREEAGTPFDLLGQTPMLRCALLRIADQEHAVVLTMHHIATDGWSMGVLVREFMAHYAAAAEGRGAALPSLAIQYGDYARWQHAERESGALRQSLDYWVARLVGIPEVHDLPLDHPRPPRQRFTAQRHNQLLDRAGLDAVKRLANATGATLFMVLQSAFAHLLSRWSGQRDIVIGTPTAGRDQTETAPLIGFFNNTVLCRFDVDLAADARALIAHGRAVALDAFTHQQVPFDLLVETFCPQRSLAYNPLCQIKFVLQNHDGGALELPGLHFEPLAAGGEHVHFDLDLTATESDDGLHLGWTFKDELFEHDSIERMAAAYVRLLHAMCSEPQRALAGVALVDEAQTRELFALGRGPSLGHGRQEPLVRAFERTAQAFPQHIAVRCGERAITYRELDLRANRLAQALIEQGVGSGDRIGIFLGRSIDLVIGLLATHKSGAAYVPLDGRQSAAQLQRILTDAGVRVALHHSAHPLHAAGVDTVFMDGADNDPRWFEGYPNVRPGTDPGLDDSAYVIYTSGSTGTPKGVEVAHRGMVDYCAFARQSYYSAALAGSLVVTSPAFDLTVPALFVPLLVGGTVDLMDEGDDLTALAVRLAAANCGNALLRLTPSHVQGLLHLLDETALPQAHVFVIGGERFPVETAHALQARFPAAQVYNHYGPTETVVGCSWYDVSANLASLGRTVPIGRPMHNTVLYVLDARLLPVPLGVAGELYIGGAGVARGYLGQPALTAERFLEDPFRAGERIYRSGDRVRWGPDGQLEFLGRADDQIKLRGFRIELGEIEHHLATAPGVRRAVVRLVGEGDQARLVGYVEPAFDAAGIAGLRAALAKMLPAYMLPAAILGLDALPLTVNGKIDRHALPVPQLDDDAAQCDAPATETERRLAALWQRILKRECVHRSANFFAMGGHSLLATRLVGDIGREFGKPLPVRAVFEHTTLHELAAHLDTRADEAERGIPVADRAGSLPLSFAQQRLWFIDRLEGGSAQFNMPSALRLQGAFESALFQRALNALLERHEILRTVYADCEDGAIQVVRASSQLPIASHDLRELAGIARAERVQALRREEAFRPFDLTGDPVLRCALLRLRDEETVVLLTVHHIASDGWSNGVLVRELVELYDALRAGRMPALAPLPVQYADYALWQRRRLQGEVLQTELAYWRQRLAGIPWVHSLPLDRPRPAQQDFSGNVYLQILDASQTTAVRAFCAERGITLFVLMRALFSMLIGRASREQDIVLGTPVAGRVHRDLEGMIGLFVNTLVLRTDLGGNPRFDELLEHCRRDSLEAYAHQEIPFENLVEELKPPRSLSYNPLVQILLNVFESVQEDQLAVEGIEMSGVGSETPESLSKADMTLYVRHFDGQLLLKWSYRASLFEAASVRRLASGFGELLRQAIAVPQARILDYALLPENERHSIVAQALPERRRYDDARLHERVQAKAATTPEATALIHHQERIDYLTLDARARALAAQLHARGVTPGETVGILADRSIDYAVAVLACLNVGAVYLPLAADLPQARIAYMLRDADVRVLLVEPRLRERADGVAQVILLGTDSGLGPAATPTLPRPRAGDGSHLLFTSGSTGQPKRVLGTHGALVNRVEWMLETFPFADDEVCCLITSTAFVRAVWELAVPLAAGRPSLIVDAQTVSDLAAFARLLAEHRVTRIVTAPSLARALTELPDAATLLVGLRYWFVSGEPLRPGVAKRIRAVVPGAVLCNLYGSTETMSDVSFHIVGDDQLRGSIPIGRPIANSALLILDECLRPVPPGMPGEICVAGENLALGYPGRIELTAEKFVRHGLGGAFGERLYRTGDLGRVLADGAIECLGRLDHQVKLRGFRIELGEVEASLLRSGRVKDAVAMVLGGEEGSLVAYLLAESGQDDVVAAVRAELRDWLPDYMQPSTYVVMERFPLTANGKVDRRALPEPTPGTNAHSPAGTPTEATVAAVWRELLKLDRVGIEANFFEIGGHSLLATRMASALASKTGKAVSVRMVFEAPVLADLARRIDAHAEAAQLPIPRAAREGGLPMSLAQQRLWFVSRFAGGAQYNLPTSMRIAGALDKTALRSALDALVARHEVLRTTYAERNGNAVQIVHPPAPFPITLVDLSHLEGDSQAAELQRLSREEARMPFDLATGPVLRCTLVALASQEHALLFTVHHIASDGWSKGLLVREFVAAYAGQAQGVASSFPALEIQYADYAAWQRSPEQASVIARDLEYWKKQLANPPQVHALPLDRLRPVRQDYRAGKVVSRLQRPGLERLRRLALDYDATLFMALQAGLALLVGRWSGETDVVIGAPVAGRTRRELEPLIGFFINSLALRFDLSGNPDVRTLLARTRRTVLDAFAHQNASFEMLVETLQPERHLSHGPLFQVVLALQNHERETLSLPGLAITAMSNDTHSIDLDLHVAVTEDEHGLQFRWLYATSLFDAATVERMAESYLALLAAMAETPEQPIMALPLLPAGDRAAIEQWACPQRQELPCLCAHALFEQHASATPQAIAITCDGESLSYGALNAQANRVAHWLRSEGVGPGQLVGLCAERSLDMIVGLLGILKSGAAYLPVDPAYPQERVEAMLADGGVEHVLAHASVLDALAVLAERTLLLLDAELRTSMLAAYPETNPDADHLDPAQAAYAVFTSGSTGTPKGVLNTHRGLVNLAFYQQQALEVGPGSRVLAFGSISFDGGVFDWLMALAHGGSLHICNEDDRHSVQRLSTLLVRERITHAAIPPALLAQMPLERDYALRLLIIAGETCDESLAWRWAERCRVVNSYGPSEAAVAATHADIVAQSQVTLGQALPNVELRILNACGQPQPVGVSGELYLGGAGLALGYLGRPELTAERFVVHPDNGERRLYRTGDLVRWLPGGKLQFLGRADDQVKIRGFRVELSEIVQHLLAHAQVREAVAIVRTETGDPRLVAYVVPAVASWPHAMRELREHLRERVPDYLMPSAIVAIDALPLNRNGKVDRTALPQPDYAMEQAFVAPVGDTEQRLAAIWQRVLKQERISAGTNFFEMGGHSLLATQVISHVAEEFGRDIPIRVLFEHPTIAGLARRIDEVAGSSTAPAIVAVDRSRPLPLSFSQQRLWFIDRMGGGSAQYNMRFGVRLAGRLDALAVRKTIQVIVERHEILRTTFAIQDGESVQVVHPALAQAIVQHDLSNLATDEREAALDRIVRAEAAHVFDLTSDPMLRCTLVHLQQDEHALLLSTHHIASDGWSMNVLGSEFAALYEAFSSSRSAVLPSLRIQYGDYASWQRTVLEGGGGLQIQLEFWRDALTNLPPVHGLRLDKPRPALQQFEGDYVARRLDIDSLHRLKQLALGNQASLFMVLQAALAVLIGRWSGEADIVIGTPVAGRTQKLLEPMIGFFVNSLVLRTDLSGDPSFIEVLRRTRTATLDAFAHQQVPFEMLVEALRPERSLSHSPLYQISFTLHNHQEGQFALPGFDLRPLRGDVQQCRNDLELHMTETEAGIHIRWVYATSLFERGTIERMADAFQVLVAHLLDQPGLAVNALPLLTDDARDALLPELRGVSRGGQADRLLHRLFEARAADRPDAVAVTFGDSHWSYGELNRRANRVAHALIAMGVKPDDRVALCVARGPHLLAGVLAILKAGGGYVPLDPAYPQERLHWMMLDSTPVALLAAHGLAHASLPPGMARLDLDDETELARHAEHNPDVPDLDAEHLAYVIYTSGSTGTPKGVQVEHRQVFRLLAAAEGDLDLDESQTWTLFHSFAFDFSVWEIWGALAYGGRLVVVSGECVQSPEDFYALLCRERVTVLNQTPSAFRQLILAQARSAQAHCLRTVIFGGEALDPKMLGTWAERNDVGRTRLVNMYGITETTVHVTIRILGLDDIFGCGSSVIGRPLPGMSIYILNPLMQPNPVGVVGEIYVGGSGVARGYLNRKELTELRFVDNPFDATGGGGRLYRSGDLARWTAQGDIEYLGRNDFQVKIRGFRIELGEVEARLARLPGVREVAVLAREDEPGEKRLIAYLVTEADACVDISALRQTLIEELPDYMVPKAYVALAALPLTANGKLDRHALPVPDRADVTLRDYADPVTDTERVISNLWTDLMSVPRVSRFDDFFELGGHSVLAIKLMATLSERFDARLHIRDLFRHPVLVDLARHVDDIVIGGSTDWHPLVPLDASPGVRPLYCFPAAGLTAVAYRPLAKALQGRLALHVLDPCGTDGRLPPSRSMHETVELNLRALLTCQPQGPYLFAGHSYGGAVAFEVARVLEMRGHQVQLALIDSAIYLRDSQRSERSLSGRLIRMLGADAEGSQSLESLDDEQALRAFFAERLQRQGLSAGSQVEASVGLMDVFRTQLAIHRNYRPTGRFGGQVISILARDGAIASLSPNNLAGHYSVCLSTDVEVHLADGGHLSMLSNGNAFGLADLIAGQLTAGGIDRE